MKITDIVPKRKRLSAIYIDGEFALKLDTEAVLASRFSVGSEISDEELRELIDLSNEKRAKEKALWLIRRDSDEESAKKAVERMEELGLVDDERYARRYCEQLINVKHLSRRGAMYKLSEKGIDKELAEQILDELDPDPREHISIILETKYKSVLKDEKGRRRAVAALQRMGYSWGDINAVLSDYTEECYEI